MIGYLTNARARSIGFGLLLFTQVVSSAQAVVVTPADFGGWFKTPGSTGSVNLNATSPAGNPLGPGALRLVLSGTVAGERVNAARIPVPILRVDEITAIAFSVASNTTELPTVKVEYFQPGGRAGTLIPLLPAYPGDSSWVTFDGMTLQWVSTEDNQVTTQSFAAWKTELGPIAVNFFSVGIGSSGAVVPPPTTAFADQITLNATTWDFEGDSASLPAAPLTFAPVPSLSGWALIMLAMMIGGAAFVRSRRRS